MQIGDKVRDTISGLRGTITGRTEWLNNGTQVFIQPTVDRDGNYRQGAWVVEAQVVEDDAPRYFGNFESAAFGKGYGTGD